MYLERYVSSMGILKDFLVIDMVKYLMERSDGDRKYGKTSFVLYPLPSQNLTAESYD